MIIGGETDSNENGSTSEIVILGSTSGSNSTTLTTLPSVQANVFNPASLQIKQAPRQAYLRTNSTNYPAANGSSNRSISSLTVTTTPVIVRSTTNLTQVQLKRLCSKRGKEEALSNSSSSDEEEQQRTSKTTSPPNQKLHQLILNTPAQTTTTTSPMTQTTGMGPLKLTFNKSNTNNLLTVNMINPSSQPQITPVVSAASSHLASSSTAASSSSNSSISWSSLASSIAVTTMVNNSSSSVNESTSFSIADPDQIVTSPSSFTSSSSSSPSFSSSSSSSSSSSPYLKSQKSSIDQDYDSKYASSYSAASPTSICSSSATNDGTIDLQDDNSSTASGPIYVRQPGFEHHAHEVLANSNTTTPKIRNFSNLNLTTDQQQQQRIPAERITRVKKSDSASTLLGSKPSLDKTTSTKAKKKLCMMTSDSAMNDVNMLAGQLNNNSVNNNNLIPERHNVHLKPLSNRAKRGQSENPSDLFHTLT